MRPPTRHRRRRPPEMTDLAWLKLVERWATDRGRPVAAALEILREADTYILAHRQWTVGATDRALWNLLDRAWCEATGD